MSTIDNLAREAITARSISQQAIPGLQNEYELGFGCALQENQENKVE